jgi:hypothetical protein
MGRDSSGTTRPARLRHSSCVKCRDSSVSVPLCITLCPATGLQDNSRQSAHCLFASLLNNILMSHINSLKPKINRNKYLKV